MWQGFRLEVAVLGTLRPPTPRALKGATAFGPKGLPCGFCAMILFEPIPRSIAPDLI
uniref:Uncharacterized protein n=1 Tax=uncultured marine virus TaxID=186617 RepID=A0A0F7L378_9VIRU|nr:hypothetical protein [uncultured marine virus]